MIRMSPTNSIPSSLIFIQCVLLATVAIFWLSTPQNTATTIPHLTKFTASSDPRVLNVHIVPHTHDDVGWLKTVQQYYEGTNTTISPAHVRAILDTTVSALLQNEARTFVWTESKFLHMWWQEQGPEMKETLRYLIANDQWHFVNGGWCMHDEAATHYVGMIDQTTMGHQFLLQEFNVVPKIGWQLDPFGHSATQASLMTAGVGMEALFFGRIDQQDLTLRKSTRQCEGFWKPSEHHDAVFWGLTGSYRGNYGAPEGFCFDSLCNHDEQLLGLKEDAIKERLYDFLQDLRVQSDETIDNHIMLTMGSDFQYSEAELNFANVDLLMERLMKYQQTGEIDVSRVFGPEIDRIQLFYSTPEYYTAQKKNSHAIQQEQLAAGLITESETFQTKSDDFFPYSSAENSYWTGYFTSRTSFKRFERVASSFLLASRQIDALYGNSTSARNSASLYTLEDALGMAQHHDAITGTAKQHVANDYSFHLQAGIDKAAEHIQSLLSDAIGGQETPMRLSHCPLLNESICEASVHASAPDKPGFYTVVYNPLVTARSSILRLPVAQKAVFTIENLATNEKSAVPSYAMPAHCCCCDRFVVNLDTGPVPALGAITYRVVWAYNVSSDRPNEPVGVSQERHGDKLVVTNSHFSATFDDKGLIRSVRIDDNVKKLSQTWGYYTSFDCNLDQSVVPSEDPTQNSGAYIFRPSTPAQSAIPFRPISHEVVKTTASVEIRLTFEESWISQVTRISKDAPFVEVEYSVGPIPIEDGRGKEVVFKYHSSVRNNATFYTDSNGREFQKRVLNYRPTWNLDVYEPLAGNFYPINAAIYIEDNESSLSVALDRSQGGTSLRDGEIEIMVQRRTLMDDNKGVDEPMNETIGGMTPYPPYGNALRLGPGVVVRGTHRILVGNGPHGAAQARSTMDGVFAEPLVFIAPVDDETLDVPSKLQNPTLHSPLGQCPPGVFLLTFARTSNDDSMYLARFAHQFDVGEDETFNQPITFDLGEVFADFHIIAAVEMSLTGNEKIRSLNDLSVTLKQMEIKTFEVTLNPSADMSTIIRRRR